MENKIMDMFDVNRDANQAVERYVIKRSGEQVPYESVKIFNAVKKACDSGKAAGMIVLEDIDIQHIADKITAMVDQATHILSVEEIQDAVEQQIGMAGSQYLPLMLKYERYRSIRNDARKISAQDKKIFGIVNVGKNADGTVSGQNEEVKQENSNKNPVIISTQRDYIAGETSRNLTNKFLLPEDIVQAHKDGIIHFHDSDYFLQKSHNCDLVNFEDMLQNGTVISGTMIEKPHSFYTACNITTQIIAQVASNQYGGQSFTLAHLAPFVDVSRKKIRKQILSENAEAGVEMTDEQVEKIVNNRLKEEITRGVQTIQYQLITLMTCNGQAPFVTMFMYLDEVPEGQTRDDLAMIIEEVLKQRIQGVKNEKGVWITPAFPKIIYALDEDNIYPKSKYYYLTELAAKCTAKRMVPDYISAKIMRELKGDVYPCMGCRSFLTPDNEEQPEGLCNAGNKANAGNYTEGSHKYYGRFNQGVVTINLVDVACSSYGDMDKFWEIFDERLELCHRALQIRHNRLMGTPSDVAPILWQHGALARLKKGETIDKLLFGNYSTLSLGYAGLYEMCMRMLGVSHTDPKGKEFALKVMQHMNDKCAEWRKAENISYSLYGTPMESTTYKFAKCLQKRFGVIKDVTDHNYITNSYHVNVREKIDAFTKLKFEFEFQKFSPGGAISYVEVPNMQNNIPAVLSVMKFIYNNIMYAELNTKSDYCECCGYDGEMKIIEDEHGTLVWECPNCGNRDQSKMSVARRTCGRHIA